MLAEKEARCYGQRYPWERWLNGLPVVLRRGVDYRCSTKGMAANCYAALRRRGVGVTVSTDPNGRWVRLQRKHGKGGAVAGVCAVLGGGYLHLGQSKDAVASYTVLQDEMPYPLDLLGVDTRHTERWHHERLKNYRAHGSWFLWGEQVERHVQRHFHPLEEIMRKAEKTKCDLFDDSGEQPR